MIYYKYIDKEVYFMEKMFAVKKPVKVEVMQYTGTCLLYTSDAADE